MCSEVYNKGWLNNNIVYDIEFLNYSEQYNLRWRNNSEV